MGVQRFWVLVGDAPSPLVGIPSPLKLMKKSQKNDKTTCLKNFPEDSFSLNEASKERMEVSRPTYLQLWQPRDSVTLQRSLWKLETCSWVNNDQLYNCILSSLRIHLFHVTGIFLYLLKISQNLWCSVFWDGLTQGHHFLSNVKSPF